MIEDHPKTADLLERTLSAAAEGVSVEIARSSAEGLQRLAAQGFDCVLLDYSLPDGASLACLSRIRAEHPDVAVVMVTGTGSEEIAVDAMKLGAADYIVKHGRYLAKVPHVVQEAIGRATIGRSKRLLQEGAPAGAQSLHAPEPSAALRDLGFVAAGKAILATLELVRVGARSDVTVLLEGETGTGKELIARAIHLQSARVAKPFVAQNCAALAEGILESELFGSVRGAFTGADRTRHGLIEAAHTGTLFLDEISEASSATQAMLLRFLQEREVRRVGETTSRAVDARVVVASNRDLRREVETGRFRLDLYHRLNVFPIRIPPLRERPEDVTVLAQHFLAKFTRPSERARASFAADALQAFRSYPWPGNVRELENEVRRIALLWDGAAAVPLHMLSPYIARMARCDVDWSTRSLKEIVRDVERATIQERLQQNGQRRAATARSLGITREGLWLKLRQMGFRTTQDTPD